MHLLQDELTYIPEGLKLNGYVARSEGVHGELFFTYIPMVEEERSALADATRDVNEKQKQATTAQWLAKRILRWTVKHPATHGAVEPSAEVLMRLPPMLSIKVAGIISGTYKSDKPSGEAWDKYVTRDELEGNSSGA